MPLASSFQDELSYPLGLGSLDTALVFCSALGLRLGHCILTGRCSPGETFRCFSGFLNGWQGPQEIEFQLLFWHLCFLHEYLGKRISWRKGMYSGHLKRSS